MGGQYSSKKSSGFFNECPQDCNCQGFPPCDQKGAGGTGGDASGECDTGIKDNIDSQICKDCIGCAQQGPCNRKAIACFQGATDCNTYRECLVACVGTCDANMNKSVDAGAETDCFNKCAGDAANIGPDTCEAKLAKGAKDWLGYVNCAYYDTCGINCGVGGLICDSGWTNTSKPCADCDGKKCCPEFTACFKDASCKACLPNPAKNATACDATMLDEAANACQASNCASECGVK